MPGPRLNSGASLALAVMVARAHRHLVELPGRLALLVHSRVPTCSHVEEYAFSMIKYRKRRKILVFRDKHSVLQYGP